MLLLPRERATAFHGPMRMCMISCLHANARVYRRVCRHVCRHVCIDVCGYMCADKCVDMRIDMRVGTQNDRLTEAVIFSTGASIPAQ